MTEEANMETWKALKDGHPLETWRVVNDTPHYRRVIATHLTESEAHAIASARENAERANDYEMASRAAALENARLRETNATLTARIEALEGALTPSDATKAEFAEFSFVVGQIDDAGEEWDRDQIVPWTTIKEIMKAISHRAALKTDRTGETG